MVFRTPVVYVLGGAVLFFAGAIVQLPFTFGFSAFMQSRSVNTYSSSYIAGVYLVALIPSIIAQMFLMGISVATIKEMDNGRADINVLLGGFRNGVKVFFAILLTWIMLYLAVFLVIFGLRSVLDESLAFYGFAIWFGVIASSYVLGWFSFAPLICLYEGEKVLAALRRSFAMTRRNPLALGLVFLVAALSNVLGLLALIVGVAVTLPLLYMVQAMHFRDYQAQMAQNDG